MSVLILDNKRILLRGMKRYELTSDELYHRNDKHEERFLFFWLMNEDELWSIYSFEYLYIKMDDGTTYKFYSDRKLKNWMKYMAYYFKEYGIGLDAESLDEEDVHHRKAVKSYVRINDEFIFVEEDISFIAYKIDYTFGTI